MRSYVKATAAFVVLALALTGAVGCSRKSRSDGASTEKSNEKTSGITLADTSTSPVSESETVRQTEAEPSENGSHLSPYTESFVRGECSVTLMYPRYGDGEHELFDISMHSYAVNKLSDSGAVSDENSVYEITACLITHESATLVSAVLTGHIINTVSANESGFAYSVNADPRTGRIYASDELIDELEAIGPAIADGRFVQRLGTPGVLGEITAEDMTGGWRRDYGIFPSIYFTEDCLGVLAELPNVLGGYAGFELPLSEAGNMINDAARLLAAGD